MRNQLRLLLTFGLLNVSVHALAAQPAPGRWALRAGDRTIMTLELHKGGAGKSGWTGALSAPSHFNVDPAFTTFSNVEGPAKVEPVVAATEKGDSLEFNVRDSATGLSRLVWKPSQEGGTLEFEGLGAHAFFVPATGVDRVGDTWDDGKSYSTIEALPDSAEMTAMFDADQGDRANMDKIDWNVIATHDAARRTRTKALLDAGKLNSGTDFYHAAFIFQHGQTPADYLLAHTLAVVAAARGRADAAWIAAATLDRYLMSIGQKQIYGTQFATPKGKPVTQEPYDRALVSDALRQALGVPAIAEQEKQWSNVQKDMDELNKNKPPSARH